MDSLIVTGIFLGVVGLGVAGQIVLGDKVGLDVIGNLQGIVDGFVEKVQVLFNYLARSSWSYLVTTSKL